MRPFSSKENRRVAVFVHDGTTWHAQVFAFGKPRWKAVVRVAVSGQNPRNLPDALLDFAEKHGARRVRLALPQNVHTLRTELPVDAEPEEVQTAMAFEMSSETGDDVESLRVAAARAERFSMGATPGMLLAAAFDQAMLEQYEAPCRKAGLAFEGVGALELAVLGAHAERRPDARLLLLRRDAGFYAMPGTELSPLAVGGVALGVREGDREFDPEWRERTGKRFKLHQSLPLLVGCVPLPDAVRQEQLRALVGEGADVAFHDVEADLENIARQVAEPSEVGVPGGGGAVVGPREPEKDPHRAGTWLFFLVLFLTIAGLGLYWQQLHTNLTRLKEKTRAWETITQERKSLQSRLDSLTAEKAACDRLVEFLAVKSPLPDGLIPLLNALDRAMPEFTRITAIEQDAQGGFLIRGHTAVQDRLPELDKGLLNGLGKLGYPVTPRGLSQMEGSTNYQFLYQIGPKDGK